MLKYLKSKEEINSPFKWNTYWYLLIFYGSKFYKVRFRGGKINDNTHCVSMSEIWNHHQLRLCHSAKKCEDVDYRGMTLHLCCHQISLQLHLRKKRSAVEILWILNRPKSLPNAVSIHNNKNMDWNHISGDSQNGSLNYYGLTAIPTLIWNVTLF